MCDANNIEGVGGRELSHLSGGGPRQAGVAQAPTRLELGGHHSPMTVKTSGMDPPTPIPAKSRITSSIGRFGEVAHSSPKDAFKKRAQMSEGRRPAAGKHVQ